jgi:hypothetical protein
MQPAAEHAQHHHLMPAVMGSVRQASHHDPSPRTFDIEDRVAPSHQPSDLSRRAMQPFQAAFSVTFHELDARFFAWRRWIPDSVNVQCILSRPAVSS